MWKRRLTTTRPTPTSQLAVGSSQLAEISLKTAYCPLHTAHCQLKTAYCRLLRFQIQKIHLRCLFQFIVEATVVFEAVDLPGIGGPVELEGKPNGLAVVPGQVAEEPVAVGEGFLDDQIVPVHGADEVLRQTGHLFFQALDGFHILRHPGIGGVQLIQRCIGVLSLQSVEKGSYDFLRRFLSVQATSQ